jgi:hypothetical protein
MEGGLRGRLGWCLVSNVSVAWHCMGRMIWAVGAACHIIISPTICCRKAPSSLPYPLHHPPASLLSPACLQDRSACALFMFPTKALAQDQLRALRELCTAAFGQEDGPAFDVYDGDTPMADR